MRSMRPLLLIPLAACAAPEHAEAPNFSWAWRAEIGQPITLDPAQSGDLLWSVVDAPEGSSLWSLHPHEGSTFTMTPDVSGEVLLNVERCDAGHCGWGEVYVQVGGDAPSSQRLSSGGLGSFGGVKLPTFGRDRSPIAAAAATVSGRWIELDGTASTDPDGDTLSYSWTLVSVPAGVSMSKVAISGTNDPIAEFNAPKAGNYEFQLTVAAKRRSSSVKLPTFIMRVLDEWEPFPD